jgi:hypothetical protein
MSAQITPSSSTFYFRNVTPERSAAGSISSCNSPVVAAKALHDLSSSETAWSLTTMQQLALEMQRVHYFALWQGCERACLDHGVGRIANQRQMN